MQQFSGIDTFVKVAETLNFTEAGRRLGLSASAVGKSVSRLEDRLGVQLFQRNTRAVALTEKGEEYLYFCRQALEAMTEGERRLADNQVTPTGRLRIGMPLVCSPFQATLLRFMQQYPDVDVELDFSDRFVDVIEEGFDLVVRTGKLTDSRLMSTYLGRCKMQLVAAPTYLNRRGRPDQVGDLTMQDCLRFRPSTNGRVQPWPVPERVDAALSSRLTCSHVEMLCYAALQGAGIAYLPDFLVNQALDDGALEVVLPGKVSSETDFHLIWPANTWRPKKLDVAIAFLRKNLLHTPAPAV